MFPSLSPKLKHTADRLNKKTDEHNLVEIFPRASFSINCCTFGGSALSHFYELLVSTSLTKSVIAPAKQMSSSNQTDGVLQAQFITFSLNNSCQGNNLT